MMVAMMLPSAAPAILLYARVHRHSLAGSAPPTAAFLAGYLACLARLRAARRGAAGLRDRLADDDGAGQPAGLAARC